MRALLVYPRFPDTFWSFRHALRFIRKRASLPPLGLLTVAAMLPERWEVRLVDMNVTTLKERDLEWADCVFLSAMMVQRDSAEDVIARCQARGVRTVAGGPLFTSQPDAFPQVDHLVLGEGEIAVRTWERGAGATLACGTGVCASAVAANLLGRTEKRVRVRLELGTLEITLAKDGRVLMKGPAQYVFEGEYQL